MTKLRLLLASVLTFLCMSSYGQTLTRPQIRTLKSVIWKSIHTYHTPDGTSEFRGSYDWHSDVHAHWALLSMARVTKDYYLEKKMRSILTMPRLEKEYRFLMAPENINFEKPYGRAWFLLMLKELNSRPIAMNARFQQIRWSLTNDMLTWLENADFPENKWNKSLIGSHDSWLMSLFLFDTAKSQNAKVRIAMQKLINDKMIPLKTNIENHPMDSFDFLYLPALKYLIKPDHRYQDASLDLPADTNFACHYPGAIQVSLWAHSGQCARKDVVACELVKKVSSDFFNKTGLWKDNFDCVSHWVPQFTWMTHWLSLGKP